MSTNKTANLQLHSWTLDDSFRMSEFNDNFNKIDTAVAGIQTTIESGTKFAFGSYTGSGSYGSGSPNRLTFSFQPKIVFLESEQNIRGNVVGWFYGANYGASDCDVNTSNNSLTWSGKTLSWYNTTSADKQLNTSGRTYRFFAVG